MIARLWHGRVPLARSDDYLALMRKVALPDYRATPGNRGAWVLHRRADDAAHFEMLTFWDSLEAIAAFAGPDAAVAKYYDFDRDFLLEFEPTARHFALFDN